MFVFSEGSSRDVQVSPKRLPLIESEYSIENSGSDYIETEEFEILWKAVVIYFLSLVLSIINNLFIFYFVAENYSKINVTIIWRLNMFCVELLKIIAFRKEIFEECLQSW